MEFPDIALKGDKHETVTEKVRNTDDYISLYGRHFMHSCSADSFHPRQLK